MLELKDFDLGLIADAMQDDGSMGVTYYLNVDDGSIHLYGDGGDSAVDLEDERFVEIARLEAFEAYRHMEDFTMTLPEGAARAKLEQALIRSKPFGHFKDALRGFEDEGYAWVRFKDAAMTSVVITWLVEIGALEDPDRHGGEEV